jgi:hypothetical protein
VSSQFLDGLELYERRFTEDLFIPFRHWLDAVMRVTFAFLVAFVLVATGCGGPGVRSSGPTSTASGHSVDVRVSDGSARLVVGELLRVDMGRVNTSIGDSWSLVTRPDPAVLTQKEQQYDPVTCTGCDQGLKWTFSAVGAGTTTIVFQYCYRSSPPRCQPEPSRGPQDPVSLNVTVTSA